MRTRFSRLPRVMAAGQTHTAPSMFELFRFSAPFGWLEVRRVHRAYVHSIRAYMRYFPRYALKILPRRESGGRVVARVAHCQHPRRLVAARSSICLCFVSRYPASRAVQTDARKAAAELASFKCPLLPEQVRAREEAL